MPQNYTKPDQKEINIKKMKEIDHEAKMIRSILIEIDGENQIADLDGRKLAMVFTHIELARMYLQSSIPQNEEKTN